MLSQAAKAPHNDISQQEVERAVRLCEHLLYLQRQQRASLKRSSEVHANLAACKTLLQSQNPPAWRIDQVGTYRRICAESHAKAFPKNKACWQKLLQQKTEPHASSPSYIRYSLR